MKIHHLILISLTLTLCATLPSQVTINLTSIPEDTPSTASIYIAGTFNNWNPGAAGFELSRGNNDGYSITLPDDVRGDIEFKFTLGSWETVEISASGEDVPNREFSVPEAGETTYKAKVEGWKNMVQEKRSVKHTASPSVSILSDNFEMPQLGRSRRIWLYLPPDYKTSGKRYPALYMHDGQNVFDEATSFAGEWGVDETLDELHSKGDPGIIVVAIDNGEERRLDEYSPWKNPEMGGGEGDAYLEFIVKTLKPYIDENYRTLPGRQNTAIAGSSMGGMISLYAILKYPDVFGKAGVFSPALWFAPEIFEFAEKSNPPKPGTRIYFVSGAKESHTGMEKGVYEHGQKKMIETLQKAGFKPGEETISHIKKDGEHSEWFWRREFEGAYFWLFER